MSDLSAFLLARITEDEETAREAVKREVDDPGSHLQFHNDWLTKADEAAERIANRFGPARVLAECDAKRRIIEQASARLHPVSEADDVWREALRLLAVPFADHPDYDETWRP